MSDPQLHWNMGRKTSSSEWGQLDLLHRCTFDQIEKIKAANI